MRDQRQKSWEGQLPTGTSIELHLPDVEIAREALEKVPSAKADHLPAATEIALQHQMRMCLEKVGGEPVTFRELRFGGLDETFTPREQQLLKDLLQRLTRPTEAEMARFKQTIRQMREDGEWRWEGRLLTGSAFSTLSELEEELEGTTVRRERVERKLEGDLEDEDVDRESLEEERQRLEERIQQLEDDIAAAKDEELRVSGQLPGSKVIRRSKEQIPNEASPALAAKEFQENLLRNAVDTIGDEEVSYRELRGTKLDEWFSPKEQHLLITVLSDELTADDDESQDFLTSVEMG
jgi:chromosome segregation ATPase